MLFGTAGDAMRDALPDAVEACFFAHDDREPAVAGAQDIALDAANRFASLAALPESEHVLVLAAPFALAEEDALFHLAETHLNTCLLYTSRKQESFRGVLLQQVFPPCP